MGKNRKTVFKGFDYMHCDDFARYLEEMAAKGWHFKEWGVGLKFEKGEPEQAVYAVEVFEKASDSEGYLYTAPSLHWTKDANNKGSISIYKLSATTGEILWEAPYNAHTVSGVSGGIQSSPLLGKPGTNLEGMIFYAIARTKTSGSGTLVALDTATGQEVWRLDMDYYAWSSPVGVYDAQGNGYVVLCDSHGTAHFIDGATGSVEDTLYLGGLVEASPAVYNNMIVVGTRLKKICGIRIR